MDAKSIWGLTAILLMIPAIVGLVTNFILKWTQREDISTTANATENSTSPNLDNQWANDKIIVLSHGKG